MREERYVGIDGGVSSEEVKEGGKSLKGLVREAVMDSQEDGHDAGTCKGTILGLGPKTDFASDDKWSQGTLGKVIVSRDGSIVCPVIKAMGVLDKYLLK